MVVLNVLLFLIRGQLLALGEAASAKVGVAQRVLLVVLLVRVHELDVLHHHVSEPAFQLLGYSLGHGLLRLLLGLGFISHLVVFLGGLRRCLDRLRLGLSSLGLN